MNQDVSKIPLYCYWCPFPPQFSYVPLPPPEVEESKPTTFEIKPEHGLSIISNEVSGTEPLKKIKNKISKGKARNH